MAIQVTIRRYRVNDSYHSPNNPNIYTSQPPIVYQNNDDLLMVVETDMSVNGDGTVETPVTLLNDEDSVDENYYYGTGTGSTCCERLPPVNKRNFQCRKQYN